MKVKWLNKALQYLDDAPDYIAKEDPAAANAIVQRIFHSVSLFSENPAMGAPGRIHGTRELIVPGLRYVVAYRVKPRLDQIEILRVFQSSRRLPKHW